MAHSDSVKSSVLVHNCRCAVCADEEAKEYDHSERRRCLHGVFHGRLRRP